MKIKLLQEDKLFSLYIRTKAKGFCEHCKKYFGIKKLQASHFIGRRNKAVRWDEENVSALCFYCHMVAMTENPLLHTNWMKKKLGARKFNKLVLRANKIKKWSKDDLILLRKKLKELIKLSETI
tara:strand:+ start:7508 stop:7879 length:372 start_codon:yes stop_codon:yes gene_type:complete